MSLGALSRGEWRERSDQDDVEPVDGSEVVGGVVVGRLVVGSEVVGEVYAGKPVGGVGGELSGDPYPPVGVPGG
jgi:hypothetical protein